MSRFGSGTLRLAAVVLTAAFLWPSSARAQTPDEPRALQVQGDVVGTHDPSIIREGEVWYLFATTPPNSKTGQQFPIRCSIVRDAGEPATTLLDCCLRGKSWNF